MLGVSADEPAGVQTIVLDGIINTHVIGTTYHVNIETQDGDDSYNPIETGASADFEITALHITGSFTAGNKVYDGDNTATVTGRDLTGELAGDDVSLTGGAATFSDENVANDKTVTLTGATLGGTAAGNYVLDSVDTTTADITALPITVTAVTDTKVYDGTNASDEVPTITVGSLADGDTATWTQTFNDRHVGSDKPLTPAGSVNDGNGGANYAVTLVPVDAGFITPRPITVTAATDTKVYDDNNSSVQVPTITDGSLAPGDIPTWVQSFDNENVGTGKLLTPEGSVADGNGSFNYAITFTPAATGTITPRPITVTAVTDTKEYDSEDTSDGVPTITEGSLTAGDDATWTQWFDSEDVGNRTLIPTGTVNDGNGGLNYDVNFVNDFTGVITARELTVTGITANDKEYDTNVNATIDLSSATLNNAVFGDDVQVDYFTAYGEFDDKVAELNKTVTIYSLSLYGDDAANYSLAPPTTTASISQALLTVTSVFADNKVYDGNADATVNFSITSLDGVKGSDDVTPNTSGAYGGFVDASVGNSKTVFLYDLSIEGADVANYWLTPPTTTADITPAPLTVTGITAENKVYDGNTDATIGLDGATLDGIIGDDVVGPLTLGATGAFADKNVGTGKTVTISGVSLDGNDADNYAISPDPTATADISEAPLTVTGITASDKVYDGNTDATLDTDSAVLVGVVPGDDVSLTGLINPAMLDGDAVFPIIEGATGNFYTPNVGVGKTVAVSVLFIIGDDAVNYSLAQPITTTADITPRPITVTADAKIKYVGDPDPELTYQITSGSVAGEDYFSGSLSREAGETAGSYAIEKGTLVVGATFDMTEGAIEYKMVPGANYNMTYVGAALTINARQSGGGGGGGGGGSSSVTSLANVISDNGTITDTTIAGSYDGRCTLTIPEGTTAQTSSGNPLYGILITEPITPPTPPDDASFVSLIYEFRPAGATFDPPITLTFTYSDLRLPEGVDEADLSIGFYNSVTGEWIILEGVHVNPETNTITGLVSHFSAFSVIASTKPAEFTVSNMSVSPAVADIGEPSIIKATVTNSGALSSTYSINLKVNDAVVETKQVSLSGHSSQEVSFTVSQATAGEYTISIDGASTLLTVRASEAPPPPETTPTPKSPAVTTPAAPPAPTTTGQSPSTPPPPPAQKPPAGPATTQPAEAPAKGTDPWMFIGGGAGAIIVIGAALLIVRSRRR